MSKRKAQFLNVLPALRPSQTIIRISPSKTGRAIYPNMLGKLGGLLPENHANPSSWSNFDMLPIQWVNGLWSSLDASDRGTTWQFYPVPDKATEEQLEEAGL